MAKLLLLALTLIECILYIGKVSIEHNYSKV